MSTKISVAVGADGLKSTDSATRQARRRDRLDSEALRKQIKDNADDTNGNSGFNNKTKKSALLDDPAAHARKNVIETSGLCGAIIQQFYEKEIGDPSEVFPTQEGDWVLDDFLGHPGDYKDQFRAGFRGGGRFMQINIQAISKEGIQSPKLLTINLERNRRNPVFCVEPPQNVRYWDLNLDWNNPPSQFYSPFPRTGYGGGEDRYTNSGSYVRLGDFALASVDGPMITSDLNAAGSWLGYWGNCREIDNDGHGQCRGNQQNQKFSWGQYEVDNYNFPVIDPETGAYLYYAEDVPEYGDPGYQFYMLPLNDSHAYIVILYNDVDVNLRGLETSSGSISNWSFEDQIPFSDRNNPGLEIWRTSETWECSSSRYINPPGVNVEMVDDYPITTFTDEAKSLFQQIYIVELKDGEASLIKEDRINEKLRASIAMQMPLYLKSSHSQYTFRSTYNSYSYVQTGLLFEGTNNASFSYTYKPVKNYPHFRNLVQSFLYQDSADRGIISMHAYPRFHSAQARNLSMGKGYGIGFLTTDNHFNSPYNDSKQLRFPTTSRYMANDIFFTPAIYHYLDPEKGIIPTLNYPTLGAGLGNLGPKRFLSLEPAKGSVKILDFVPSGDISTPIDESSFSGSFDAPAIKNATHVAWNWDDPQLCWQYLIDMGFTAAMIGPKPDPPKVPADE